MKTPVFPLLTALLFGLFAILAYTGSSGIMGAAAAASLLCGLFAWVLPRVIPRVHPNVWILSGMAILAVLFASTVSHFADLAVNFMLLIPLALINAAFLLHADLKFASSKDISQEPSQQSSSDRIKAVALFMGSLLVVTALYNLYTSTVWDNTYDSLGYIWLFIPVFAILLSGLTLLTVLPSRTKWTGLLYMLLLPVLLVAVSSQAQRVDFRHETAQRAERVVEAIEAFYTREGHYPESLSEISPSYILALPEPVVIYGQDWCYESGDGYYRLGYVDREHWSDPRLIGRIFKTKGEVPDLHRMCEAEITAMQAHDPDYSYTYWRESE